MSKVSIPRIGKVTYKNAPNVSSLPVSQMDENQKYVLEHARNLVDGSAGRIVGWYMIAWDQEGAYKTGCHIDPARSPIGYTIAPSFIADAVRRTLHEHEAW